MFNKLSIFFCLILTFLVFPSNILALESINIVSSPLSKFSGEEFDVTFEATSLVPSSSYYMKGLGGGSGSALTEVDTWNSSWFQQNASWISMPTFNANSEGSASATLKLRFDPGVETATKDLKLRIRKTDTDKNIDSNVVTIQITKATPNPTVAPTVQPSVVPTLKPTEPSTAKPVQTKNPTPKSTPVESPIQTLEQETVLGVNVTDEVKQTSKPDTQTVSKSSKRIPNSAITLIFLGLIFLGYGGYLLYNNKNDKNI